MIAKLRAALVPLNTHKIGWGGFALTTLGVWGPVVSVHFFPNLSPDVKAAIEIYGSYLAGVTQVGVTAAFIGRAPQIH